MELDLQIIKDPYRNLSKQLIRVFSDEGGTVGRAADSYWLLPDPKNYLSGRHCMIEQRGDGYWLTDTSRNGVFLNKSKHRIGFGHEVQLHDGDRLQMGLYEVLVKLRERGHPKVPSKHDEHGETAAPMQVSDHSGNDVISQVDTTLAPVVGDTGEHNFAGYDSESDTGEHARIRFGNDTTASTESMPVDRAMREPSPDEPLIARASAAKPPGEAMSPASVRFVRIDRAELQARGHLPPRECERLLANQFRHIKRSLLANAFGRGGTAVPNGHLMMVTSALPGDGKTFTTLNLAFSLATEKDLEVVLIDADSARHQLSSILGVSREIGLMDVLSDESLDAESFFLPTDVKGLSIMPAGHCAEDIATELLTSSRMEDIVARIGARKSRRIAIFDSSPLLLTNESRVLGSVVGQVVVVVRAGVTPQQAVEEAIGFLGEDKPVGVILNQSTVGSPGGYYGYGDYGYATYGQAPGADGK